MKILCIGVVASCLIVGCADEADVPGAAGGKADSSAIASFWIMEWDGELVAKSEIDSALSDHRWFVFGALQEHNSVPRMDELVFSNVTRHPAEGSLTRVTYHARVPIAWGKSAPPASLQLTLPKRTDSAGLVAFAAKYKSLCVDNPGAHINAANFFYSYRPGRCLEGGDRYRANGNKPVFAPDDIIQPTATLTPSPRQSSNTYPEYHKVWEDNALNIVATFGSSRSNPDASDAGVAAYDDFVQQIVAAARAFGTVTLTPEFSSAPGLRHPVVEVTSTAPDGRVLRATVMLTNDMQRDLAVDAPMRKRYEALTPRADAILYNGHAGYGGIVRAIADAGRWVQGQYVIMFENGCDTYGYNSETLFQAHAKVNPDDPRGSKYLEEILNVRPAYFTDMAHASMQLVTALLAPAQPKSYEQIMRQIAPEQVVLVIGDEDNAYQPAT